MNAIRPIARTDDTVTLRASDYEALISALEDAQDAVALVAAGVREQAIGTAAARADHLPVELVTRLLGGEAPARVWREHRGLTLQALADASRVSLSDLASIDAGGGTADIGVYRSLAAALAVTIDDLIPPGA